MKKELIIMLPKISLQIERWKFNKEYGVYVSTLGNFKDRNKQTIPIKINRNGYCVIQVDNEKKPYKTAHRLVMLTWRPMPNAAELTVDHLNHNKRDNSLKNLEWISCNENLNRARKDYIGDIESANKKKAKSHK